MKKVDTIIDAIKKNQEELNPDIALVVEKKCQGKSKEEIVKYLDILLDEPPEETGGQNALTGFYFQLLCTLYYLAEVLEGKWDFLVLELHQDIIVGNDSTIKFIQVKSEVSNARQAVKKVTDTELYRGGWIQKLLSMGRLFPTDSGLCTQFELITNYVITNSRDVNVEHYLYNTRFDQTVDENDDVLEKLKKYKKRGLASDFDIEVECKESLKDLLSRFLIKPKAINRDDFEDFIGAVGSKFGRLINESAGVALKDLNYLIGELVFACNHTSEGSFLHIDKESAFGYLQILKERASKNLEGFYNSNNNIILIDTIINNMNDSYEELSEDIKGQLQDEFETFREELKGWTEEETSVVEMVHRYLEGKSFSLKLYAIKPLKLLRKAEEIFKTLFLLKIIYEDQIKFSQKFKGILVKEVQDSYISIIGLDMDQTSEEGVRKLSLILEKASKEEKVLILMQNNSTIFQGEYDEDFTESEILTVDEIITQSTEDIMADKGKSLKEVDYNWTIIPGVSLTKLLKKMRKHEDICSFKDSVKSTWKELLN